MRNWTQQQGLRNKQYSGHCEAIQLWRGARGGNGVWCLFVWGVSVNDSPERGDMHQLPVEDYTWVYKI